MEQKESVSRAMLDESNLYDSGPHVDGGRVTGESLDESVDHGTDHSHRDHLPEPVQDDAHSQHSDSTHQAAWVHQQLLSTYTPTYCNQSIVIDQSINPSLSSISQSKESIRDASETRISKTMPPI